MDEQTRLILIQTLRGLKRAVQMLEELLKKN